MTGCARHHGGGSVRAAAALKRELEPFGIAADVHDRGGVALVSVRMDLVVWTEGTGYWWATGRSGPGGRRIFTSHTTGDPRGAARRIAARCAAVRQPSPRLAPIAHSEGWAA